jgi:hypothetical protein
MSASRRTIAMIAMLCASAARGQAQGAAKPAAKGIAGTWRGTSVCTPVGKPTCHDEVVVYRVRELGPAGSEKVQIVMNKIVNAKEDSMATLVCSHASGPHLVACPMRGWTWTFQLAGDTLSGTLANPTGVVWRNIRVARSR